MQPDPAEESAGAEDSAEVPSLADLLGQLDEEELEDEGRRKLVVDQDAVDEEVASYSVDQLLLRANAETAKAVALFGSSIVALPFFGHVFGLDDGQCLSYEEHPAKASNGIMDRLDLESKFGSLDPRALIEELQCGESHLVERLKRVKTKELRKDVLRLQEWRRKANGRLRTLERRAAWAVLGIPYTQDQATIRKAFKKRALELHPDKGGDAQRFQLLQEMRDSLILPEQKGLEEEEEQEEDEQEIEKNDAAKEDSAEAAPEGAGGFPSESGLHGPSAQSFDGSLEELEKLFQRAREQEDKAKDAVDADDAKSPDRPELEAARKKIHVSVVEAWRRASELAAELGAERPHGGGQATRALRRFVERFAATELSRLDEGADVRTVQRILRRFLEQGSEVLCAASILDPDAAIAEVATKVNCRLLSAVPGSPELQQRCAQLLEALRRLPQSLDGLAASMEQQSARAVADAQPAPTAGVGAKGPVSAAESEFGGALTPAKQAADFVPVAGAPEGELQDLFASAMQAAEFALGAKQSGRGAEQEDAKLAEERRKRFAEERKREEEQRRVSAEARRKAQEELERREAEAEEARVQQLEAKSRDLAVVLDDEDIPAALQHLRTEWEACWQHSCAGGKRSDGSAIFCEPCNCWVAVPRFDHTAFELHCEKAGHTDWID